MSKQHGMSPVIPDDYDGTDRDGERRSTHAQPICDCPMCGVLPWQWSEFERGTEARGIELFRAQVKHHRNEMQASRRLIREWTAFPTSVAYEQRRIVRDVNSLKALFAYRRSLRGAQ